MRGSLDKHWWKTFAVSTLHERMSYVPMDIVYLSAGCSVGRLRVDFCRFHRQPQVESRSFCSCGSVKTARHQIGDEMVSEQEFESAISQLTKLINNQFPRPWMTSLKDPRKAQVFVVGRNQRNGYPGDLRGGHNRHLDALFNRQGESCRGVYDEVTGGYPSPTRQRRSGGQVLPFAYEKRGRPSIFMTLNQNDEPNAPFWPLVACRARLVWAGQRSSSYLRH